MNPTADQNVLKTEKGPAAGNEKAVENTRRFRVVVKKSVQLKVDRLNDPCVVILCW